MDLNEKTVKLIYPEFEDSRLNQVERERKDVVGPGGLRLHAIFCLSCGKRAGLSLPHTTFISYICDDCAATHGGLPTPEIAEEELIALYGARKD
jgi:hypothetical protein